jgi:hypothetical protein
MNATPRTASDVADGIWQRLGVLPGVSGLTVTAKGTIVTVKATVSPGQLREAQAIIDGYKDSGCGIVFDHRANA